MKMCEFHLRFHWSLFLRVQLTIFQHWFRWWLGADQATSHYLNQCWYLYRRIYASLSLNELKWSLTKMDRIQWPTFWWPFNPLHAKLFIGNRKCIYDFYHSSTSTWHRYSWNPSSCKARTYLLYIVNIMVAGGLVTQGASALEAMALGSSHIWG